MLPNDFQLLYNTILVCVVLFKREAESSVHARSVWRAIGLDVLTNAQRRKIVFVFKIRFFYSRYNAAIDRLALPNLQNSRHGS